MAARKTTKNTGRKEKRRRFSFFANMDQEQKSIYFKCAGVIVLGFALFTLVSATSYLFTWQADQSLLSQPDMLDRHVDVHNWGGKMGYRWSHFLVSGFLGLGSFAFVFLFRAITKEEILLLPKGQKIYSLLRRVHLMK